MRYTVFQLSLSEVDTQSWEGQRILELKLRGSKSFTAWMSEYYREAAIIVADSLEDTFDIGNGYGDENHIIRLGAMRSMSVGDVVYCHSTGTYHMCDPFGWTQLLSFTATVEA